MRSLISSFFFLSVSWLRTWCVLYTYGSHDSGPIASHVLKSHTWLVANGLSSTAQIYCRAFGFWPAGYGNREIFILLPCWGDVQLPDLNQYDNNFLFSHQGVPWWQFLPMKLQGLVHPNLLVLLLFNHCVCNYHVEHKNICPFHSFHLAKFHCCWSWLFGPR